MGYSNRLWVCPYYTRDYKEHMSCEGGRVELPSIKATRRYMETYCASECWKDCTLARALNTYYDEKEITDHAQDKQKQGRARTKRGAPPRP